MPQKKSAFKRLRQDEKKHSANKSRISEMRTMAKNVRALISQQNKEEAELSLRKFESKLNKAVKTNTVKKNTASRRISRLRKHIDKIGK